MNRSKGSARWYGYAATGMTLMLALAACTPGDDGDSDTAYPSEDLEIMAPADPGGGWDGTARAMQDALTNGGVVDVGVTVSNVGGAAGTIGLAQFVEQAAGDPHQLMVMGMVMVGGILTNDSAVTLDDVTPIASLTTEWEAIAVVADSEYQTLEELITDWQADPTSISWGGGSAGGTDHILIGLMAQEAGIEPDGVNYVAHAGGGEALAAILSGAVTAGVSGLSEFRDQVEAGEMRLLGVSSDEPIEGVDSPTIADAGLDVVLSNWRGVVAPPDISDEERDAIVGLIEELVASEAWQDLLEANGWTEFVQTGEEFEAFLAEEDDRITAVLQEIGLIE
ncbi:MAG TPA: tripartite tricarboxylate transporter substrate-binding protein [Methylomirabilota bacterium]|nr:tripartite tricarboxylate transporter substrate-binding protein [Methylomirabilota bacterium]